MASPLVEARSISKSYAGVRALKGIDFELRAGEVHALVGENGAGKSTLVRIITGATGPDTGFLAIEGHRVDHMDPGTGRSLRIAAIYQQSSLFPHMSVAENIAMALERGAPWRRVDWKARRHRANELLTRAGSTISSDRLVSTLSIADQQLVEIARSIATEAKILILDEPTVALGDREVSNLFESIRRLRDAGTGIVYISHRLEEIASIADRVTVLRDGSTVGTMTRDQMNIGKLIGLMVGRELTSVFPKRAVPIADTALELRRISSRAAGIHDVSLAVRRGEVLGIGGLVGSGRTELAQTIFGITPADSGAILRNGVQVTVGSPRAAAALRIGYVSEDRRENGVILKMSIAANASLANLAAVSKHGMVRFAAETRLAQGFLTRLRIKAPDTTIPAEALSGGNQQKVSLARWLAIDPEVLILDEPTQGIDVGSKAEIHSQMMELAEQGLAVIMISSEMPELLGMSDRIAVMRGGRLAGILSREEATQQRILELALGHDRVLS